jgi:hypothetical protein
VNPNVKTRTHPSLRRAGLWLAAATLWSAATNAVFGQTEDGIKAAFLYNFAKFTEWPAKAFADGSAPITVGFVGADSLADLFAKNVTGKNANGRDFAVKKLTDASATGSCQIVFVGDASQAAAVLDAAKGKAVLTAGDGEAFGSAGGAVSFVRDGAKMTFNLDLNAANAAELKLDQKLRQIARSVKGG